MKEEIMEVVGKVENESIKERMSRVNGVLDWIIYGDRKNITNNNKKQNELQQSDHNR